METIGKEAAGFLSLANTIRNGIKTLRGLKGDLRSSSQRYAKEAMRAEGAVIVGDPVKNQLQPDCILLGYTSSKPNRIEELFNQGMNSQRFRELMKEGGVTMNNVLEIVSYINDGYPEDDITNTTTRDGKIHLNKMEPRPFQGLAHELTNRKNSKKFAMVERDLKFLKISPEEYADRKIDIEIEAIVNQVIVASELGTDLGDGDFNDMVEKYRNKKISEAQVRQMIEEMRDNGRLIAGYADGRVQTIQEYYIVQGIKVQSSVKKQLDINSKFMRKGKAFRLIKKTVKSQYLKK